MLNKQDDDGGGKFRDKELDEGNIDLGDLSMLEAWRAELESGLSSDFDPV